MGVFMASRHRRAAAGGRGGWCGRAARPVEWVLDTWRIARGFPSAMDAP